MSVVAPPPQDEQELLIREARARQRKRWLLAAALTATAAGVVVAVSAIFAAGSGAREAQGRPKGIPTAPRCAPQQLRLGRPRFDGAGMGKVMESMSLTNTSSRSCTLRGWPVFDVVLPNGRRAKAHVAWGHIRNATASHALPVRAVLVTPGGAASFHAYEADGTGLEHACGFPLPSVRAFVIPPGSTESARGAVAMPYCRNPRRLVAALSPVVAGPFDSDLFR